MNEDAEVQHSIPCMSWIATGSCPSREWCSGIHDTRLKLMGEEGRCRELSGSSCQSDFPRKWSGGLNESGTVHDSAVPAKTRYQPAATSEGSNDEENTYAGGMGTYHVWHSFLEAITLEKEERVAAPPPRLGTLLLLADGKHIQPAATSPALAPAVPASRHLPIIKAAEQSSQQPELQTPLPLPLPAPAPLSLPAPLQRSALYCKAGPKVTEEVDEPLQSQQQVWDKGYLSVGGSIPVQYQYQYRPSNVYHLAHHCRDVPIPQVYFPAVWVQTNTPWLRWN
ncbi:unnamed protein product [Chrysoparadoxa australica]